MSSSERIKELKIDSALWADPKRITDLLEIFIQNLIALVIHQTRALKIL